MFEHTSLQEDRFGYHATGKERFIGFLKGLLVMLAAIVGIAIVGSLITWLFKLIGLVEIGAVVSILLLFAAILAVYPLLIVASTRYQLSRTSFREARFRFTGKPMELAKIYAKGIFLSLITLGIYGAWFHVELQNYMMKNTAYGPARFEYNHTKFNGIQMASDLKGFAFFKKYLLSNLYRIVPEEADQYLGKISENNFKNFFPVCQDSASLEVANYLEKVANTIKPQGSPFDYRVTIVKSDMVNAFAFPGGRILFSSSLIQEAQNTNELTGVLAHEIGHVEKRHGMKQLSRAAGLALFINLAFGAGLEGFEWAETLADAGGFAVLMKYSRHSEKEADQFGAHILHKHGYSVQGLLHFMKKIEDMEKNSVKIETNSNAEKTIEIFSSHPVTHKRIADLQKRADSEKKSFKKEPAVFQFSEVCP